MRVVNQTSKKQDDLTEKFGSEFFLSELDFWNQE